MKVSPRVTHLSLLLMLNHDEHLLLFDQLHPLLTSTKDYIKSNPRSQSQVSHCLLGKRIEEEDALLLHSVFPSPLLVSWDERLNFSQEISSLPFGSGSIFFFILYFTPFNVKMRKCRDQKAKDCKRSGALKQWSSSRKEVYMLLIQHKKTKTKGVKKCKRILID